MHFNKLLIPLETVIGSAKMILISVAPNYAYQDGKRTDTLIGYRYIAVEDSTFEKFSIKIESSTPMITQEQIDAAKQHIIVTFDNAVCKPYRTQSGDYDLSISATGISIVK